MVSLSGGLGRSLGTMAAESQLQWLPQLGLSFRVPPPKPRIIPFDHSTPPPLG